MPKITTPRDTIVDEYEIIKILSACKDDKKLLFAVAVAWKTGARIGEIVQLRAKDFSEQGDQWFISIPTLKQRTLIHGQLPKRLLPINKDAIYEKIIKPELLRQTNTERPIVFPDSQQSLRNRLKARYPDVYFHWFRHSASSRFSRNLSIFELQSAMGWKDIRMANIYVHNQQMTERLRGKL
jgi:integrase